MPTNTFSFAGTFAQDTDQREFFFTTLGAGGVLLRTYSYAGGVNGSGTTIPGGGFDPTLSLFDSSGRLVAANQDGGCGRVGADAVTSLCWDSYMLLNLPAGVYRLVLTQSTNTAKGPTLADSFEYFCSGANQIAGLCTQMFTPDPSPGVLPPGFWDQSRHQRTGSFALDIRGSASATAPAFTNVSGLPMGVNGLPYPGYTFTATAQPSGAYTWSLFSGTLPPGLVLNPATGSLTGTPSTTGTYSFTIQADDGGQQFQQSFTLVIYNPVSISTASLPPGTVGQPYGPVTVAGSGGAGVFSWSAANLPAGLTISAAGVISGIPTGIAGTSNVTLTVLETGSGLSASSVPLPLSIAYGPLIISGTGNAGEVAFGTALSRTFAATGGAVPYSWSAVNLPAGMTINAATGTVSGVPAQPGNYTFNVVVSDSATPTIRFSLPVTLQVFGLTTSSSLPGATAGVAYSAAFNVAGGSPPYTFSSPNAPGGLSFNGSVLSGAPAAAGTYSFTVRIMDGNGFIATSLVTLLVSGPMTPLSLSGATLTGGLAGTPYLMQLQAIGGALPYIWKIAGGALPDGLSLGSDGSLAGTPSKAGLFTFTALVTDGSGASQSATFTITIAPAQMSFSGVSFPNGIAGSDYPVQVIAASGGVAPYKYQVTGTLPPGLSFVNGQLSGVPTSAGTFSFSIVTTDSGLPPTSATSLYQVVIAPANSDLVLSSQNLAFALTTGASGIPAPYSVTVQSNAAGQSFNYSAVASPAAAWLNLSTGTSTPGSINLSLNPSATALPASAAPLTTSILVTCLAPSPCAGRSQTISVSLTVAAPAPQLLFNTNLVEFFAAASSTGTLSQPVAIQNVGAGTVTIQSITAADAWLTVTGSPGSLAGGPAVPLLFTANPAGLAAGFYRTLVTIQSSGGTATVPVALTIAQSGLLTLSTTGTQFQSVAGGPPGNATGSFQMSTASGAAMNWSAAVQSGASWLRLTGVTTGSVNSSSPATVSYSVDPVAASSLAAGVYYGTVTVSAASAMNPSQTFLVVLNVAQPGSPVAPNPQPAGLTFTSGITAPLPVAQTVTVYSSSVSPAAYSAAAVTASGGSWLSVTPASGMASVSGPGTSTIAVSPGNLAPGVYNGSVGYQSTAAAVRTVNVTLVVQPNGSCAPAHLVSTQIGLTNNFAQHAGWPTPLSVTLAQDCAAAISGGQVEAAFSNGDAPVELKLVNAQTGTYSGTWTPHSAAPQVTVTTTATAPGLSAAVSQITGEVMGSGSPMLNQGGTLHIFDPLVGGTVGQGNILQIYGSALSAQPVSAATVPLPGSLGGTSVTIGGLPAPLFYVSDTQINAQLPVELAPGNRYDVIVNNNGALSAAGSVNVNTATPGVAVLPSGQVVAQRADGSLVSEGSPAKPGDFVAIYLSGMGATDTPVADGVASPSVPLVHPVIAPILTLNGINVPIAFAGLSPQSVGLFQINFQIPANTPNGDLQLLVSQGGVVSNPSILPVHN